jgi:glycosyltransferase involved in cell wall biosynthesis
LFSLGRYGHNRLQRIHALSINRRVVVLTPAVSIIVPIYNSEAHLSRCLQSISDQTFPDFEVLCVDDCSADRSAEILAQHQERDSRFRLIRHAANLGAGGARNTGIANALAPYLAFVDSDDFALPTMIDSLHRAARDGDHDIVVCGFFECDETGAILASITPGDRVVDMRQNEVDIFTLTNAAVWNKLWRRALFTSNAIAFPETVYYQDLATTPRLVFKARTIRFIDDECYCYMRNPASVVQTHSAKHILDHFEVFDLLRRFCLDEGVLDRCATDLARVIKASVLYHASNVRRLNPDDEPTRRYLRRLLLLRDDYLTSIEVPNSLAVDELIGLISADPFEPREIIAAQTNRIAALDAEIGALSAGVASRDEALASRMAEVTALEESLRVKTAEADELRLLRQWPLRRLRSLLSAHSRRASIVRSGS